MIYVQIYIIHIATMIHSLLVPNVFTTSFPTSSISSIGNAMNQHSLLLTEINNNEISGNMQHLLNSHFLLYSLRQNLYSMVLNQSHIYKEIAAMFRNITELDIFYYSIFAFTIVLFWKDLPYKKSTQKIIKNGVISRDNVRFIEMFVFVIMMVLFQDVDNATG